MYLNLARSAVDKIVERSHAISFGPEAHLAGLREGRILHLKDRRAVKDDFESAAGKVDAQRMPNTGRHRQIDAVSALAPDDVERAALSVDGLVQDHVVFEGIRSDDIVVLGVLGPPDETAGAIVRSG